eukprot:777754-Rhodomonas_salina.1
MKDTREQSVHRTGQERQCREANAMRSVDIGYNKVPYTPQSILPPLIRGGEDGEKRDDRNEGES